MHTAGPEELQSMVEEILGPEMPGRCVYDVAASLELIPVLEERGFVVRLVDACPKSMSRTLWRVVVDGNGRRFTVEHDEAPIAICSAFVRGMSGPVS